MVSFVSWMASASEMALLISTESSLGKRKIWLKPGVEDSPDILIEEGGKMSVEESGEGGGEFIGIVKCDMIGTMSKY